MLRYKLKSKTVPVMPGVTVQRASGFTGLWCYFYDVPCVCENGKPHYHTDGRIRVYPEVVEQPRQCDYLDACRADGVPA